MEYKIAEQYHGFELKDKWHISEVASEAYLFEHLSTGAKLLYLKNDDDNKVFSVSFRTPPVDSCGTPHIMEHSVLCGSEKYPLKEPFVELVKSSLNTFLNAMTFPDKTMYPVASKNHADFKNLIDVYCDAVFHPLIAENKFTFYQEGWHYHLENINDPITINGVVYNEMKGAFSNPEEVMMRHVQLSLYPETAYAYESGGDPDVIPELTYEKFMEYYDSYYHPSNSYFYYYGDLEIEPYLAALDQNYLTEFSRIEIDSLPKKQTPYTNERSLEIAYSIDENDTEENKAYFTANYKIGNAEDSVLLFSMNVLVDILMNSDASPLKKALLDADIADEIAYHFTTSVREPYLTIIAKNAKADKYDLFIEIIDKTLRELVEYGIDGDIIKSALNGFEFDLREADSGNYPRGLLYSFDVMDSWLYDAKPGIHLEYEPYLTFLRANENSAYYTQLITEYLLDNRHKSKILLLPQKGLALAKNKEVEEGLQKYKEQLSENDLDELVETTTELIRRQRTLDSEEAKNSIPVLSVSEIEKHLDEPNFTSRSYKDSALYLHTDKSRGIAYVNINFPMDAFQIEDVSVCSLLASILGVYKTLNYSELALANEIGIYLGDINIDIYTHQSVEDAYAFQSKFGFDVKSLEDNLPKLFEISTEILLNTVIDDADRLYKTVCEEVSKFEAKMINGAHVFALNRLNAYMSPRGEYNEYANGVAYYKYLTEVKEQLESKNYQALDDLNRVKEMLVSAYQTDILIMCEKEQSEYALDQTEKFIDTLPNHQYPKAEIKLFGEGKKNEGIIIPSNVMYVGMGYNYKLLDYAYDARMLVVKKYLTSVFLWDHIRLLGGAYGAMMSIDKTGMLSFVSYRDPKVKETIDAYRKIPQDLKGLQLSSQDINKLIIGTISSVDAPMPIYVQGRKLLNDIYKKDSWEKQQKNREIILSTTAKDISDQFELFDEVINNSNICVVGAEGKLQENKELFDNIYSVMRKN